MSDQNKTTPLYSWHVAQGANMAPFAGYAMPLWYTSAKNEHLAVLTRAGLFDTSHMAVVLVSGPGSLDLLQWTFSRDLQACLGSDRHPLHPGRSVYGLFCTRQGHVIDDAILTQFETEDYMLVVNAGMGPVIADHLRNQCLSSQTVIADLSGQVGKIDLQGPRAGQIMSRLLSHPEKVFDHLPYFACKGRIPVSKSSVHLQDSTPILLSRSGYTGEFGFEIFVQPEHLTRVWTLILETGQEHGLLPCGLAARDSLRTGAVLPLSHNDIGDWPFLNTPWDFVLPWDRTGTGFSKEFLGGAALLGLNNPPQTVPFVGHDLRKVSADSQSRVLNQRDEPIGRILTCVTDVGIGWHDRRILSVTSPDAPSDFKPRGLSCGFVRVTTPLAPGDRIRLQDKRRTLEAIIVDDIRPDRTARKPLQAMLSIHK